MWKSGTFDLEDINETLINEIVFFDISYPGMGEPGCMIFITKSGDEYIISQEGTHWNIIDMVQLFPEVYEVVKNKKDGAKDEYGFTVINNWKIIPVFAGDFLVRVDYFEKFYPEYQAASESRKNLPLCIARLLFGRDPSAPKERMVYVKNQECWDAEKNRLSDTDVPWIKYNNILRDGYIKFLVRRNRDGTLSAFRWLIQEQKEDDEEGEEGFPKLNGPIECYNLFIQKYENMDPELFNDLENIYFNYVKDEEIGKFVRSYKNLEKAKEAASIRNEMAGWGEVNKKNIYMIDYEYFKKQIEGDSQIFIL